MGLLLHLTSLLSAAAAGALFAAVWQGAVLVACVAICLRWLPGLTAAARSTIWLNVFALLVLLHLLPAVLSPWASAGAIQGSPVRLNVNWSILIVALWGVLSVWKGAQLILNAIRLHRMARRATPAVPGPALKALLETGDGSRLSGRSAELCTSAEVTRPSVFGFFRPRILMPPGLMERLTSEELWLVVQHEMEHLRRGDDWSNLVQKLALVAFPLESGHVLGGTAALFGTGIGLRRPRALHQRQPQGVCDVPDTPGGICNGFTPPFPGARRV